MEKIYQLICPHCGKEIPGPVAPAGPQICPTCGKEINDNLEVRYQPALSQKWPKRISLIILLVLAALILLALARIIL